MGGASFVGAYFRFGVGHYKIPLVYQAAEFLQLTSMEAWASEEDQAAPGRARESVATQPSLLLPHSQVYLEEGGPDVVLRFLCVSSQAGHVEAALRHLHHLVAPVPGTPPSPTSKELAEALGAAGTVHSVLQLLQVRAVLWR